MKKNVLFVIESLSGGGAEKVLVTLIKHLDSSKYNISLCTVVDTGKYVDDIKPYVKYSSILGDPHKKTIVGKFLYALKYKFVYAFLPMKWVYRLFIPKGNDVEIAFCEGFVTKLLAASEAINTFRLSWVHTDLKLNPWPQQQGVFHGIEEEARAYSRYNKIVVVSRTARDSFNNLYGQANHLQSIYNPIDVDDISSRSLEFACDYDDQVINLITVGRLVPQKGYDLLLKVANQLKNEGYKFMLRILGEGEQYNSLSQFISEYKLEECVKLLGFKRNPYPYIAQSDLFVCSSRSEGYSLVIAESLVLGVPVISTYCSGPNELLDEGKYGMLVENDDSGIALYDGLKTLMNSSVLLDKYRQKAKERARSFSLEDTMRQVEQILD